MGAADTEVDIVLWSLVDCNTSTIGKFNSSSVFCLNELQAIAKNRPSAKFLPLATEQQYVAIVKAARAGEDLVTAFERGHWKIQNVTQMQTICANGDLGNLTKEPVSLD